MDYGHVSFASHNQEHGDWQSELTDANTLLPKHKLEEIKTNLQKLKLPLMIDNNFVKGSASSDSGNTLLTLSHSALWHVVGETIFYHDKLHLTEKIFKPICTRRPFILIGAKNNLQYLRNYGFKTFSNWISEDYDNEPNHDTRIILAVNELEKLCKLSMAELKEMHLDMQEILLYNYNHFYNEFRKIIVDEMLDNFQECLKIYNNGLLYDLQIVPDKTLISNLKKLFLQ